MQGRKEERGGTTQNEKIAEGQGIWAGSSPISSSKREEQTGWDPSIKQAKKETKLIDAKKGT